MKLVCPMYSSHMTMNFSHFFFTFYVIITYLLCLDQEPTLQFRNIKFWPSGEKNNFYEAVSLCLEAESGHSVSSQIIMQHDSYPHFWESGMEPIFHMGRHISSESDAFGQHRTSFAVNFISSNFFRLLLCLALIINIITLRTNPYFCRRILVVCGAEESIS